MVIAKKTDLNLKEVPRRSKDVLVREHSDGSLTLLHLESDEHFFTVTGLAVEVWQSIDGQASIQKIIDKIEGRFKKLPQRFIDDTVEFFRQLKSENLIELEA